MSEIFPFKKQSIHVEQTEVVWRKVKPRILNVFCKYHIRIITLAFYLLNPNIFTSITITYDKLYTKRPVTHTY